MKKYQMSKANAVVTRARAQLAAVKRRESQMTSIAIEKGAGVGGSVLIAAIETKIPMTILKVPTKLLIAGAAYAGAVLAQGMVAGALEGVGDAMLHVYAYKAAAQVKAKTPSPFVAGDDDVGEYEDVGGIEEDLVAGYEEL